MPIRTAVPRRTRHRHSLKPSTSHHTTCPCMLAYLQWSEGISPAVLGRITAIGACSSSAPGASRRDLRQNLLSQGLGTHDLALGILGLSRGVVFRRVVGMLFEKEISGLFCFEFFYGFGFRVSGLGKRWGLTFGLSPPETFPSPGIWHYRPAERSIVSLGFKPQYSMSRVQVSGCEER